jgi:tripartite-type tricarboxylate transporter receptor subunit TctC
MVHVPYRGGAPALTDLIGGQVQVMFSPLPESLGAIKAGQVRPLAVTTPKRTDALPDLPPIGDFVPGFEATTWQGIGAPKATPADIVDKLNGEINAAISDSGIKFQLDLLGSIPTPMSPAQFNKYVVDETAKWAKVIHDANIKLE